MSFCETIELIKEGDTAIIYLSFNQLYPIKVTKGQFHHTKYGSLKHENLIGKRYGSKIQTSKGTVYILRGSPEIWTICLPHRTQILYTPDISLITLELELKPGSIVVESGTGSGSLSHALIRTIYPIGHLHTFEFHLQRSEIARNEFKEHGLATYVTVYHRDVCSDGFGLENLADAVFLDLPGPWKALTSAKAALKKEGGRICSFSPCIEQVQKTTQELAQLGFTDITTIECLRRILSIKKFEMANFDFDMDSRPRNLNQAQMEVNDSKESDKKNNEKLDDVNKTNEPAKRLEIENVKMKTNNSKNNRKRKNSNKNKDDDANEENDDDDDDNNDVNDENENKKTNGLVSTICTAKAINLQPGHTGYLTFATLLHKDYI